MADAAFVIDGDEYPIPGLESFNMFEAMTLYEYCGLSLEDFAIDEEDPDQVAELQEKTKNPGFIFALMLVAYLRGNKGLPKKRAADIIANSNIMGAYEAFLAAGMEEDPTRPQESNPTSESSSGNGSDSGDDSTKNSDEPEETPDSTGISE